MGLPALINLALRGGFGAVDPPGQVSCLFVLGINGLELVMVLMVYCDIGMKPTNKDSPIGHWPELLVVGDRGALA
ncbi:hypothetical protein ACT8ZS_09405 [Paenibacillus sp. M.A.Huq-84]